MPCYDEAGAEVAFGYIRCSFAASAVGAANAARAVRPNEPLSREPDAIISDRRATAKRSTTAVADMSTRCTLIRRRRRSGNFEEPDLHGLRSFGGMPRARC